MPLVRAWTRGLSGASGVALLVPAGIFGALLLLALAGSFGQLRSLGEAFGGPSAPVPRPAASAVHGPAGRPPTLLSVVSAPASAVVAGVVGHRAGPSGGGVPKPPPPPGRSPSGSSGSGGAPTGPTSPTAPGGSGCGSCTSPPTPTHQTLVDQVVRLGSSVTSKLPGPVGQLTTQLLQQVGSTVDQILPTDRRSGAVIQLGSTVSQLKLP